MTQSWSSYTHSAALPQQREKSHYLWRCLIEMRIISGPDLLEKSQGLMTNEFQVLWHSEAGIPLISSQIPVRVGAEQPPAPGSFCLQSLWWIKRFLISTSMPRRTPHGNPQASRSCASLQSSGCREILHSVNTRELSRAFHWCLQLPPVFPQRQNPRKWEPPGAFGTPTFPGMAVPGNRNSRSHCKVFQVWF